MANFKAWVETSPRNGNFFVRHRDGKTKLPSGRWKVFADYTIGKHQMMAINGKKFVGKKLAEELAEKVRKRYYNGELEVIDDSKSLAEWVEQYFDEKRNIAWTTKVQYQKALDHMMQKIKTLTELSDYRNLLAWRTSLEKRGYMPNSVWSYMNGARIFCKWLSRKKILPKSPFDAEKGICPDQPEDSPRFWTLEEFLAFEDQIKGLEDYGVIACRLAHDYGLRKVEIVGDAVERLQGVLLEDLIWRVDGKVDLNIRKEITKGKKKARKIRLSKSFVKSLLKVIGARKSGPIVPMTRARLDYIFRKARELSNVKIGLTFHGQRHSFGTDFLETVGDQKALRDLFGHSDLKTTDIYSHHQETYLDRCMEIMEEARKKKEHEARIAGQNNDIVGSNGNGHLEPSRPTWTNHDSDSSSQNYQKAAKF